MRVDELTPTQRRELQRGNFKPAKTHDPSRGDHRKTAPDLGVVNFRCHTCPAEFTTWPKAERHVDETGHRRIEAVFHQLAAT
jgi:hypothetical protein